jgi:transposase
MPNRIPSAELRYIRRRLFEGRFTATALAARVSMSANTFWVALHRDGGISTDLARKIGDVLYDWADRLSDTGSKLHDLAATYDNQEKSA